MNRYKVTKQLGDGTYGSVPAVNRSTNEVGAIKKMKRSSTPGRREAARGVLAEEAEPSNIVKLKEVIENELFFVFEFMEANLYEVMKGRDKPIPEARAKPCIRCSKVWRLCTNMGFSTVTSSLRTCSSRAKQSNLVDFGLVARFAPAHLTRTTCR